MVSKEKSKITTIKLLNETKDRLDKLRVHKRETYDEILQGTLSILNLCRVSPEKAQAKLKAIERRNKTERKKNENSEKNI
jgi:hypothetical protein